MPLTFRMKSVLGSSRGAVGDLRNRLGLPQTEFGRLFSVHTMTVSRWERGENHPTPYQQALMDEFDKAAQKNQVAEQLKNMLVVCPLPTT